MAVLVTGSQGQWTLETLLYDSGPLEISCYNILHFFSQLLCQYERDSVLKFLETFDSYRVEHCLRLCQEYGITDAAAFLLERVGDVGSALFLTLSGLNDKFAELDTAVESLISATLRGSAGIDCYSSVLKMKEVCRFDFLNSVYCPLF